MNEAFAQSRAATRPWTSPQWVAVTSLSGSPEWLTDARRAVGRLAELRDGWDGQGGPAPRPAAIASASCALSELGRYDELPAAQVGPTVGGGLGFAWHSDSRELDLEILPDGGIEYLKTELTPDGSVRHMDDGEISSEEVGRGLRDLAKWLMQGI